LFLLQVKAQPCSRANDKRKDKHSDRAGHIVMARTDKSSMSQGVDRRQNCFPRTRRGGLRRISRSCREAEEDWDNNRVNAAEWPAMMAGMWSFECRIRSWLGDLQDTVERWRRCSVGSRPLPKTANTRANFERGQSCPAFQREQ